MRNNNRDITFDIIKGIGILLVIIGHLAHGFGQLVPAIYTFHMSLFFIVSGYFYKEKKVTELLFRDFRSLLVPYLFVTIVTITYGILVATWQHAPEKAWYWINSFLNAGINDSGIGPLWFLLAMFWCRMFYNLLYKVVKQIPGTIETYMVLISFLLFTTINFIPNNFIRLINYQCIINGLYAMFYFSLGHITNKLNTKYQLLSVNCLLYIIVAIVLGIICIISCMGTSDMGSFRQHIIYNTLASVAVTFLLYHLCNKINDNCSMFLSWYGRLSLVVFCFHTIMLRILPVDRMFEIIIHTTNHYIVNSFTVIFHICMTILFCKISERIKILRYLFSLK